MQVPAHTVYADGSSTLNGKPLQTAEYVTVAKVAG